jgi:Dicarboxylate transport.
LKDVSLPTSSAQIQSINGAIKLSGFWPPVTPGGQSLTATITAPGLPPAKLSLTGQLAAKPAVKLDRIAVDIAGGEISATSFTLDPASPNIATILKVDHVDLGEITKLIGLSGLNGSGQLDGQVPFTYKAGKVTIKAGSWRPADRARSATSPRSCRIRSPRPGNRCSSPCRPSATSTTISCRSSWTRARPATAR